MPEIKSLEQLVAEYITDKYGKRCSAFTFCCPVCEAWVAYDVIFNDPCTEYKIKKLPPVKDVVEG